MTNVSKENLKKVESYFIEKCKSTGNKRIEATVVEIADGSGVALATAHKAIKELDGRGILSVLKPSSRRFPIVYIYRGDMKEFQISESKDEQIVYLQNLVSERDERILELEKRVRELENITNKTVLQNV